MYCTFKFFSNYLLILFSSQILYLYKFNTNSTTNSLLVISKLTSKPPPFHNTSNQNSKLKRCTSLNLCTSPLSQVLPHFSYQYTVIVVVPRDERDHTYLLPSLPVSLLLLTHCVVKILHVLGVLASIIHPEHAESHPKLSNNTSVILVNAPSTKPESVYPCASSFTPLLLLLLELLLDDDDVPFLFLIERAEDLLRRPMLLTSTLLLLLLLLPTSSSSTTANNCLFLFTEGLLILLDDPTSILFNADESVDILSGVDCTGEYAISCMSGGEF